MQHKKGLNCFQPCFFSFLSTRSWFKRSFSLLNSLSFLFISWLYWLARLAIIFWSLCTWRGNKRRVYRRAYRAERATGNWIQGKPTSSFSFFREFCKLFTFCCSLRSLSRSPVFSLLDTSSCSCHKRTATGWTWTFKGLNVYHWQATLT